MLRAPQRRADRLCCNRGHGRVGEMA